MTSKPWMPLYIADYLADTPHLSAFESGAYLHLIMHQWQCGALPTDEHALARIAKVQPRYWPRIRAVLAPFFGNPKSGEPWVQKRTAIELRKAGEISNKRKGAALQKHSKCKANALQMHTQSQSHSQHDDDERAASKPSIGSPLISDTAFKLANEIARACGHSASKTRVNALADDDFLPPSWAGAPMQVQSWLNQGWTAEAIEASCREQLARKSGGRPDRIVYFETGIAEFVARVSARVPTATEASHGRKLTPRQQKLADLHALVEQRRSDHARDLTRDLTRDPEAGQPDGHKHAGS
jgi:uncharacterized protein YdaU (DUF1376 family)